MPAPAPPPDWVDPERRRIKAGRIAAWCAENGYDPAAIVDPKQRRQIVRDAIGVTRRPDGTKRYPRASDDTWAEAVKAYDDARAVRQWGAFAPGRT